LPYNAIGRARRAVTMETPMQRNKRSIPLYSLFLVFLGSFLTGLTYIFLPMTGVPLDREFPVSFIVYVTCICLVVAIVFSILKSRGWRLSDIGFKRPSRNMMLMGVLFFALSAFVVYPITMLINKTLGVAIKGMDYTISSMGDVVVAILICALIGPMAEEILYRGFLIKVAQQKIANKWLLGVLAISCFSIIHVFYFGIGGMIFITFWAVLPVFLFIYYDNIYPGYIMHALNNLLAYLLIPLFFGG
jgi:membrane protease YdiL (CAAX protease family)